MSSPPFPLQQQSLIVDVFSTIPIAAVPAFRRRPICMLAQNDGHVLWMAGSLHYIGQSTLCDAVCMNRATPCDEI